MVKFKKNIVVLLTIIAILSPMFTNLVTNAVEPEEVTLSLTAVGATTNLDIGDQVEVSLDLNNYLDNQNAMVVKLTYDHNVLQPIPDSPATSEDPTNVWGNKTFKKLDIYSDMAIATNQVDSDDIVIAIGGTGTSQLEYENTTTNHIANFKFNVIGTTNTTITAHNLMYSKWESGGANHVDTNLTTTSSVNLTMLVPEIPLTGINVTGPNEVNVGETITLTAAKVPTDTTNTTAITWESSDPTVASVDSNGVVTAHQKGGVSIFAKCGDVSSPAHPVEVIQPFLGLIIDKPEVTFSIGDKTSLTATLNPGNANTSGDEISWTTSNSSIVKINNSTTGPTIEIEAVANGNATITASLDGKSITSAITVTTPLTSIEIVDDESHVMNNCNYPFEICNDADLNNVLNLTANKVPANTDNTANITWVSSNPSVATVSTGNASGTSAVVSPKAIGNTTITATCGTITASFNVTVNIYINKVEINSEDLTLHVGQSSDTLTVSYTPAVFSDESSAIVWSSDNDSVATVSNGVVTAVSAGNTTIKAALASNPDTIFDTINVTVPSVNASGLTINYSSKTLNKGENVNLTVALANSDTEHELTEVFDQTKLTWESSNTDIATVDANGKVVAVAVKHNLNGTYEAGTATITARYASNTGEKTATCAITVESPIQSIELIKVSNNNSVGSNIKLEKGESYEQLAVKYTPEDTTSNRSVTWAVSGDSVSVSNGIITANKVGDAVVSAKVTGVSDATVTASVYIKLDSIKLENGTTSMNLIKDNSYTLTVTEHAKVGENENPTEIPSNVVWTSSNPSAITVNNGTIEAVGNIGDSSTITVTYIMPDERELSKSILVTIQGPTLLGLTIDKPEVTFSIGDKTTLTASLNPVNANTSGDPISWVSSNGSIVKINNSTTGSTIEIEAVANGNATITASLDGKSVTCAVTVTTALTSIEILDSELHVMNSTNYPFEICNDADLNNVLNLTANKIPTNTDNTANITWVSSNPAIATVATGNAVGTSAVVAPKAIGNTTITATCGSISASFNVTVNIYINKVEIDSEDLTLYVGQSSDTLTVSYTPAVFSDESSAIVWSSDNESVATVNNGVITAVSAGNTTIKAALASNQNVIFDTINVTVPSVNASGLTINYPSKTLNKGENVSLTVALANSDTEHELTEVFDPSKLTWESSDSSIATVDSNGKVVAVAVKHNLNGTYEAGTATITARYASNTGEKTATCAITVESPLQSIDIVKASNNNEINFPIKLEKGDSFEQLAIKYTPEDTTSNREVTWIVTGNSVSVADGIITAIKPGNSLVTAKINDNITSEVEVSVFVKLDSVKLENGSANISIIKNSSYGLLVTECAKEGEEETPTEVPQSVVWTTSNPSAITVEDGIITAVGNPGDQSIIGVTYTMKDEREISTSILVKIKEIHASSVTIASSSEKIFVGQDVLLNVNITQEEEGELTDAISFETTDADVATIIQKDGQYFIHGGTKLGTNATLTFIVGDKADTLVVSLSENHVTDFTPELDKVNIVEGKDGQISIDPSKFIKDFNNADTTDNITVTYTSLTETIATVDETGKVHALKSGNAQIKVTLSNGITTIDKIIEFRVTASSPIYEVIEGKDQLYNKDSCINLQFRIDANYALFIGGGVVYVDENEIDPSNYTSREGSTIIEFTEAFSRSIGSGAHTLSVLFNDGNTSETNFSVMGGSSIPPVPGTAVTTLSSTTAAALSGLTNSPHTGDMNVFGLSVLAIISLIGMVIIIKKNKI